MAVVGLCVQRVLVVHLTREVLPARPVALALPLLHRVHQFYSERLWVLNLGRLQYNKYLLGGHYVPRVELLCIATRSREY